MICPICHKEYHDSSQRTCSVPCCNALRHGEVYLRKLGEMSAARRQQIADEANRRNVDITLVVYEETRKHAKPCALVEKQKLRARLRAKDEAYDALGTRSQTKVVSGLRVERRGTVPMGGRSLAVRINNY